MCTCCPDALGRPTTARSRKQFKSTLADDTVAAALTHEFELHRPSNKGTKLLLKVIKAIIIITSIV
jgi:hypothetical protein